MTIPRPASHDALFSIQGKTLAELRARAEATIQELLGDEWGKVRYDYRLSISRYAATSPSLWAADVAVVFG